jgi:hypothetical protein
MSHCSFVKPDGKTCKRNREVSSKYCWQHISKGNVKPQKGAGPKRKYESPNSPSYRSPFSNQNNTPYSMDNEVTELDRKVFLIAYLAVMNKISETGKEGLYINNMLEAYKYYLHEPSYQNKKLVEDYLAYKDMNDVKVKSPDLKKSKLQVGAGPQRGGNGSPKYTQSSPFYKQQSYVPQSTYTPQTFKRYSPKKSPVSPQAKQSLEMLRNDLFEKANDKEEIERTVEQSMYEMESRMRESFESKMAEMAKSQSQMNEEMLSSLREMLNINVKTQKMTNKTFNEVKKLGEPLTWKSWATGQMAGFFKNLILVWPKATFSLAKFCGYHAFWNPLEIVVGMYARVFKIIVGHIWIVMIAGTIYYIYLAVQGDQRFIEQCTKTGTDYFLCSGTTREYINGFLSDSIAPMLGTTIATTKNAITYTLGYSVDGLSLMSQDIMGWLMSLYNAFVQAVKADVLSTIPGGSYFFG